MPSSSQSNVRWLLIFWIFVISAIAYVDRVNVSIAGQAIAKDFGLTNVQLGWVFSAFVLRYALFQAPGGWLADKIGPRVTLSMAVIWWAVFTALITWVSPAFTAVLPILIAIRFTLGIGEAVMYPASNCVVSAWIPSAERGVANGIIFAGVGVGGGVTPPLITYVLIHYGWRASLWISALLGLAVGAVWYVIARDRPQDHPRVSAQERAMIAEDLSKRTTVAEPRGRTLRLSEILTNPDVLAVTFSYFCFGYVAYIFISWFFIYLSTARGLNLRQSAFYTILPFLAMAMGSPLGGWISDRLVPRFGIRIGRSAFGAVSLTISAVFLVLGTQVQSPQWASVVLAGGAGSLYLFAKLLLVGQRGDRRRLSRAGLRRDEHGWPTRGGALTASLTPLLADRYGWNTSFIVAACLCAAGAITWLPVQRKAGGAVAGDSKPASLIKA